MSVVSRFETLLHPFQDFAVLGAKSMAQIDVTLDVGRIRIRLHADDSPPYTHRIRCALFPAVPEIPLNDAIERFSKPLGVRPR